MIWARLNVDPGPLCKYASCHPARTSSRRRRRVRSTSSLVSLLDMESSATCFSSLWEASGGRRPRARGRARLGLLGRCALRDCGQEDHSQDSGHGSCGTVLQHRMAPRQGRGRGGYLQRKSEVRPWPLLVRPQLVGRCSNRDCLNFQASVVSREGDGEQAGPTGVEAPMRRAREARATGTSPPVFRF